MSDKRKIIRSGEFANWQQSSDYVDEARKHAQEIVERAKQAYMQQRAKGYEDGKEEAVTSYMEKIVELGLIRERMVQEIESELIELVLSSTKKIIGDFDESERLARLAVKGFDHFKGDKTIQVKVSPSQTSAVKGAIERLMNDVPNQQIIQVTADPSLNEDQCILQSDSGVIDASLDVQMRRLRDSITNAVRSE